MKVWINRRLPIIASVAVGLAIILGTLAPTGQGVGNLNWLATPVFAEDQDHDRDRLRDQDCGVDCQPERDRLRDQDCDADCQKERERLAHQERERIREHNQDQVPDRSATRFERSVAPDPGVGRRIR
ncbi:MAG: hypothetical protein OES09_08960 [Gammaproteobacteria bacterium]|nr:hypothetical protein [Gammaproteobacteria bacterium]